MYIHIVLNQSNLIYMDQNHTEIKLLLIFLLTECVE